ncbi:MAG: FG-GAP-like repeat-containing protein, partial [Planctomycetota bacterium]
MNGIRRPTFQSSSNLVSVSGRGLVCAAAALMAFALARSPNALAQKPVVVGLGAPPQQSADLDPHPSAPDFTQAQADIATLEYEFSTTSEGAIAPNRVHDLRLRVDGCGLAVESRTHGDAATGAEPEGGFVFSLSLRAIGDGRVMAPVAPGRVERRGNRAEIHRDGGASGVIVEWFVNTERGLEHGFDIPEPPSGSSQDRLVLEMGLESSLRPVLVGGELRLVGAGVLDSVRLRYSGLHVYDSQGRVLPAVLELAAGALLISVETTGASFPLTVDPVLTAGASWTVLSPLLNDGFGRSVSYAGDVNGDGYGDVIVGVGGYDGVQLNAGRALVYLGSPAGLPTTPAWTAELGQALSFFGNRVSGAGDVNGDGFDDVIVGALGYDNGEVDEGGAFVYLGSPSGLSPTPSWTAESNQAASFFGISVAGAGDVNGDGYDDVIVGAHGYDNGEVDEGAAFVYLGSPAGLAPTPSWTVESNQAASSFGISVAGAGDVNGDGFGDVIVGASFYDNGQADEGGAFVYLGSPAGLAPTPSWTVESNQAESILGLSVDRAGDVNGDGYGDVIVGASFYDNGQTDEGRAFLYLGSASGLAAAPAWTAEPNHLGNQFGYCLSSAGDINGDGYGDVIIGSRPSTSTSAFVYLGSSSGLAATHAWTAVGGAPGMDISVSSAGDVNQDGFGDVIVGAVYLGFTDTSGRALVYLGAADDPVASPVWTAESDNAGAMFGFSVACAGDFNGDGYSDVIVGAREYEDGEVGEGGAFAYLGSATGPEATVAWAGELNQAGARFGVSVANAGDVNGDGYEDVIVGADLFDTELVDDGHASVYLGSAAGLSPAVAWTAHSDQVDAAFGYSVAGAGDVNGDGYGDVIVGARFYDNGEVDEGRAYLYLGSPTGLGALPAWTVESNQVNAQFGYPVASAGDVNGDGYGDVVIGSRLYDNGQMDEGRAFLYLGSATGLAASPAWTAESNQALAWFGSTVASAGDVNGDGYGDVIVGAPLYDVGAANEGRAYLYLGSAAGLATAPAWTAHSTQSSARFGFCVGSAGDVNADGYGDVIISATFYDGGQVDEGRAYIYLGSAAGLASVAWTAESGQAAAEFGISVASAGDVNGDGFGDVIVGARYFDNGQTDEGRAYVYLGNRAGVPRALQQRRVDEVSPIALRGLSDAPDGFRIGIRGTHPAGRGRVMVEYEVKPTGVLFDGQGTELTAAADTGAPTGGASAMDFDIEVAGLTLASPYHWRVRLLYLDSPIFRQGPWFSPVGKSTNEIDLRTACPAPQAAFLPSAVLGNAPLSVTFTDASTFNGTVLHHWDFDGDTVVDSTDPDSLFVYSTPGVYDATLEVTDLCGSHAEAVVITVTTAPTASFSASPLSGNAPLSVDFTSTSSGDLASHAWDFDGDLVTDSTDPSPTHVFTSPGSYVVTLTVTGVGGGADVATQTIEVYTAPDASFAASRLSGNAPLSVDFTSTSSGDLASHAWDFDGDLVTDSTDPSPTHVFTS